MEALSLFLDWLEEARRSEPSVPEAMVLATVDARGRPSARVVLLKGADPRGLSFYTHLDSRKSRELDGNPQAALVFHFKSLARQVRVEGRVEPVPEAEADAYFASRPRGSQEGAWASRQSQVLDGRQQLVAEVEAVRHRLAEGPVPRPPRWGGWRLVPDLWELWEERPHRLHIRRIFERDAEGWTEYLLYP